VKLHDWLDVASFAGAAIIIGYLIGMLL